MPTAPSGREIPTAPAYEDAKQGFRTMPVDVELRVLPVPPEKDPRRD